MTTDVIVGFPGETDADYAATRDLVERIGFDNAFIFRYSQRRDTPAAEMAEQVPEAVKEARNQDLLRGDRCLGKREGRSARRAARGDPLRRPEQDERGAPDGPHARATRS